MYILFCYRINSDGGASNKKKDMKILYHHWFPNEKANSLILDLQKPVPIELTNIETIKPIISSYNAYLTYFVRDLINLVDPRLPKLVCEKICKLARLISTPENFPVQFTSEKVYTVEDIGTEKGDSEMMVIVDDGQSYLQEQHVSGIWQLAPKHNWGLCPIGKVPWQQQSI